MQSGPKLTAGVLLLIGPEGGNLSKGNSQRWRAVTRQGHAKEQQGQGLGMQPRLSRLEEPFLWPRWVPQWEGM